MAAGPDAALPALDELEFQVTAGPPRPAGAFEVSADTDRSTRVRFTLDLTPAGFMKLMTPMITRQMRRGSPSSTTSRPFSNEPRLGG